MEGNFQTSYIPNWKVCVRCYTFNQSQYITDAMNGFINQHTTFPYICCIVDDASTDGAQEIITEFLNESFDLNSKASYRKELEYGTLIFSPHKTNHNCFFAVLLLNKNHYSTQELKTKKRGYIFEWEKASDYSAWCEGDDYWCENDKLQRQVDFLDAHPDYSLCFHAAFYKHSPEGTLTLYQPFKKDCNISFEQIVLGGGMFCPTPSLLYRSSDYFEMPGVFKKQHVGDYPLQIYLASIGKVRYLAEPMCVYRVASQNSWTARMKKAPIDSIISREEKLLYEIDQYFSLKHHTIFKHRELLYKFDMLYGAQEYNRCFSLAKEMMMNRMKVPVKKFVKLLLHKANL